MPHSEVYRYKKWPL